MAQDTTPALVLYVGKPDQTYGFDFDKGSFGDVKVAFVRRGLTDYAYDPDTFEVHGFLYAWNGGVYTKTETPDTDTPLYDKDGVATGDTWEATMYREPKNDIFTRGYIEWTGEPLTSNDVICIVRETQKDQPYSYPNNQKHIERALDNLSRQIQELQLTADNALKVDPSWNYTMDDERKMDPIAWLQTIVRSKGLTLREVRIDNGYIEYTTDDPDSTTKTWNVVAGVKTGNGGVVSHIRETRVLAEDGITWIPYLEYSVDGGNSWKPAGREQAELEAQYVKKSGDTMTGTLISNKSIETSDVMRAGKFLRFTSDSTLGSPTLPWPTAYIQKINNGSDLTVPNPGQADTLGLKSEIDLAANSGSQLTNKGVWFAKMYAATTVPTGAEYDGKNYADFSQVDGNGNPIIVLYEGQSGAWVQTQTITPPASYNGYVTVTSKIWDIVEQSGQQGGKVLWSHNQKTFTPYPQIISFEDAALTGNSTVQMPAQPTGNSIVNVDYLSNHSGGTGKDVGDIFFTTRTDNGLAGAVECNGATYNTTDFVGSGNIGGLLADGKVPYVSLADYATALATDGVCGVYGWDGAGTTVFRVPSLTDIFVETGTAAQLGDFVPAGLPNITGSWSNLGRAAQAGSGAVEVTQQNIGNRDYEAGYRGGNYTFDASRSSAIYGNGNTVQPKSVRYRAMVQLATGATDEALETCTSVLADVANLNDHRVIAFQAPTAGNNYTWYRKYADGWVEQGGRIDNGSLVNTVDLSVVFPVEMADTNYTPSISCIRGASGNYKMNQGIETVSTTGMSFGFYSSSDYCQYFAWKVEGMAQQ